MNCVAAYKLAQALAPTLTRNKGRLLILSSFTHFSISSKTFKKALEYWAHCKALGSREGKIEYLGSAREYACTKLADTMLGLYLHNAWSCEGLVTWYDPIASEMCLPTSNVAYRVSWATA